MFKKRNSKILETDSLSLQKEIENYFINDINEKYESLEKIINKKDKTEKEFHNHMKEHDEILCKYLSTLVIEYFKEKAK